MKVMSDITYDGTRKVYLEYPVLVPIEDTWPNGVKPLTWGQRIKAFFTTFFGSK